jgi:hypothetical protein
MKVTTAAQVSIGGFIAGPGRKADWPWRLMSVRASPRRAAGSAHLSGTGRA